MLLWILVLVVTWLLYYLFKRPPNFPPGPIRLPFWGSYWFLLKENYNFLHVSTEKLAKKYHTDILGLFLGNTPTVVVLSHQLCEEVLKRPEFSGRPDSCLVRLRSEGGRHGIFFTDGPYWKEQRRFSLFHIGGHAYSRHTDEFDETLVSNLKILLEKLENEPQKDNLIVHPKKGRCFVPEILYPFLLNVVLMPLTSAHIEDDPTLRLVGLQGERFQQAADASGGAISMTPWLKNINKEFFKWAQIEEAHTILFNVLRGFIEEHKKTYSSDHHRDFIDEFLGQQAKNKYEKDFGGFTDTQLLVTIFDYVGGAAIVTGQHIHATLAFLINNPDSQRKAQEEIDRVVGRNRPVQLNDRNSLNYVEACMIETLRVLPTVIMGIPRRATEDTTLGNYFIPKDTILLTNMYTAHRDKLFGEKLEEYCPERHLDSDGNLSKNDRTVSFGGGIRICAGATWAKLVGFYVVANILQNFHLSSIDDKPIDLELASGANIFVKSFPVEFSPRKYKI